MVTKIDSEYLIAIKICLCDNKFESYTQKGQLYYYIIFICGILNRLFKNFSLNKYKNYFIFMFF